MKKKYSKDYSFVGLGNKHEGCVSGVSIECLHRLDLRTFRIKYFDFPICLKRNSKSALIFTDFSIFLNVEREKITEKSQINLKKSY